MRRQRPPAHSLVLPSFQHLLPGRRGLHPLPSPAGSLGPLRPLRPGAPWPTWPEPMLLSGRVWWDDPCCSSSCPREALGLWPVPATPPCLPSPAAPACAGMPWAERGVRDECQPAGTDGAWRLSGEERLLAGSHQPRECESAGLSVGKGADPSHRVGRCGRGR